MFYNEVTQSGVNSIMIRIGDAHLAARDHSRNGIREGVSRELNWVGVKQLTLLRRN